MTTRPEPAKKVESAKKAEVVKKPAPVVAEASGLDRPEMQVKLRELILLAKEQGHLTFDDLAEAMPDTDPAEMEALVERLRKMEIEIIEAAAVDRTKDGEDESEEEEKADPKLDTLWRF